MTAIPSHQSLVPVSVVRTHTTEAVRSVQAQPTPRPPSLPNVEREQGRNRVRLWRDARRPEIAGTVAESPASRAAVRLTYGHAGQPQTADVSGQLIDLRV